MAHTLRLCLLALLCCVAQATFRNVVLITVDDLRPQLGAYGMQAHTPNIDRLAAQATVFRHAYCQFAVCSPSRNSFMSGRRPDTTKVWNFINHFREPAVGANWTSMPQYFKQNGFLTYGSGKLYHPAHPPNNDYPTSWTEDSYNSFYWGNGQPIGDAFGCRGSNFQLAPISESYGSSEVCTCINDTAAMNDNDNKTTPQDHQLVEYDHRVTTRAVQSIQRAKDLGKNFFIAAGIRKPHLEWRMPHMFWDYYANVSIDVAKHQTIGNNITTLAYEMNGGMGQVYKKNGSTWQESPNGPAIPEDLQREFRRGYYAAVSFTDFQVGRILDQLDELGLTNSTAVLLHADHGWKLGEHGDWSKCTNWELDARVPFILRAPWIESSVGQTTKALVELVDMFPTLAELAGLPPVPSSEKLEGQSLVPILNDPSQTHDRVTAFSQYPRCPQYDMVKSPEDWECLTVPKNNITRMGFSVRVPTARFTEWRVWNQSCLADWSATGLVEMELYDHTGDDGFNATTFDDFEYDNLAYQPQYQDTVKQLSELLFTQFGGNTGC